MLLPVLRVDHPTNCGCIGRFLARADRPVTLYIYIGYPSGRLAWASEFDWCSAQRRSAVDPTLFADATHQRGHDLRFCCYYCTTAVEIVRVRSSTAALTNPTINRPFSAIIVAQEEEPYYSSIIQIQIPSRQYGRKIRAVPYRSQASNKVCRASVRRADRNVQGCT